MFAGRWTVELDNAGESKIRVDNQPVLNLDYKAWRPQRAWAWFRVESSDLVDGEASVKAEVRDYGVSLEGTIREVGQGELLYAFEYVVEDPQPDWPGIAFQFEFEGDWRVATNMSGDPTLAADGLGWSKSVGDGRSIEVQAEGFERTEIQGATITMYLAVDRALSGEASLRIRLPEGGVVRPPASVLYAEPDWDKWHRNVLAWDSWPVDMSFLNKSKSHAGEYGFAAARGEEIVFENGTPAVFWGTNVMGTGIFSGSLEAIENQADRIAALGYNLVRFHHHDFTRWVQPNVIDDEHPTSQVLDQGALRKIDWWIKCLNERGVYVWIDLMVTRSFKEGDNIPGWDEIKERDNALGKSWSFVNPRIEELMHLFAEQYITRPNYYTGKAMVENPGVIGFMGSNENDLTMHFASPIRPGGENPVHGEMARLLAERIIDDLDLDAEEGMSWEQTGDNLIMLNEMEHRFFSRYYDRIRQLGAEQIIMPQGIWGGMRLGSFPVQGLGDVIDVHHYGASEGVSLDPRWDQSLPHGIAYAQFYGKPLIITEWNLPYPMTDRFLGPLQVAAYGAFQGWDAPMIYGYWQSSLAEPTYAADWSTAWDPALTAMMPAAAAIYRRGDVAPAEKTVVFMPTAEHVLDERWSYASSKLMRTVPEQHGYRIALPDLPEVQWDDDYPRPDLEALPEGMTIELDPSKDYIEKGATRVVSDTGELMRDWELGYGTIDTALSKAAYGWLGGRRVELEGAAFEMSTRKLSIALTSLSDAPLSEAPEILLSSVARAMEMPQEERAARGLDFVYASEPIEGLVELESRSGIEVSALAGNGEVIELREFEPNDEGVVRIEIDPRVPTHWWILRRK